MDQRIFVIFFVGIILSARAEESDPMLEILKMTNDVLVTYDQNLDKIVPFKQFRESIKGLEKMAENYNGRCINDINRAIHLGYQVTDEYFRATDKIFKWCVTGRTVFNYILNHKTTLSKDLMKRALSSTMTKGMESLNESINKLETIRDQLTELYSILQPMPRTLKNELERLGFGMRKKRFAGSNQLNGLLAALGATTTVVLAFVLGPVGLAIGLLSKMEALGIDRCVMNSGFKPSKEEELKITQAYYMSLILTVQYATSNVTEVKEKLNTEITVLKLFRVRSMRTKY